MPAATRTEKIAALAAHTAAALVAALESAP